MSDWAARRYAPPIATAADEPSVEAPRQPEQVDPAIALLTSLAAGPRLIELATAESDLAGRLEVEGLVRCIRHARALHPRLERRRRFLKSLGYTTSELPARLRGGDLAKYAITHRGRDLLERRNTTEGATP